MKIKQIENICTKIPLTGLLLGLSWPPLPFYLLIFFAFIPLIHFLNNAYNNNYNVKQVFSVSIKNFIVFTTITIYWIYNAGQEFGVQSSLGLLIGVTVPVSILMASAISISYKISKIFQSRYIHYFSFIAIWLSYEYISFNWSLHFPWLTLGYSLAIPHKIIQWYEFTGAIGGSLWILLVNFLIYELIISTYTNIKTVVFKSISLLIVVLLPLLISLHIYNNYNETEDKIHVAVIQPNLDSFTKKFNPSLQQQNFNESISLSKNSIKQDTRLIVWPETILIEAIYKNEILKNEKIQSIKKELLTNTEISLITGVSTIQKDNNKYKIFNSAILLNNNDKEVQLYHKNKLVPFAEYLPYPKVFSTIENLIPQWGLDGIKFAFYEAANTITIFNANDKIRVVTAICYDSVFGNLLAEGVNKGANLIVIITNDGWWKNTHGYKQHALYAKFLAIANRRSIARSANTGISEFINQRGDILQATKWDEQISINTYLNLNNKKTFYTSYNNYIEKTPIYLFFAFLIISFICKIFYKNTYK